jgi:peroxisomal membrane protein 4
MARVSFPTTNIDKLCRFKEKVKLVLKATRQHARNLARFAAIYKTSMLGLRYLNPTQSGKEGRYDTFFSGLLGGYVVFGSGRQGSVNQQVWCRHDYYHDYILTVR